MNPLEQYLKPPTNNNNEQLFSEENQKEEENMYHQIQENGNEKREDKEIDLQINQEELHYSKNDEDNDIIQGINNIGNKDININQEENQFDIEENNIKTNYKNDYDYLNNNLLNLNEVNNDENSQDNLMNELLFKIRKIKEKRKNKNSTYNDTCKVNNIDNLKNMVFDKTKNKNRNEFFGKLNINNQIFQNNPKMKELANLLKDYSKEKNENDKIQINFYNTNNQINIIKPEVFFNNNNNKNKNIDYYNKNIENKHYISVIDGRAIINGKRIKMKNGFQNADNNLKNYQSNFIEFNNKNNLFEFNNEKILDKKFNFNNNNFNFKLNNNGNFFKMNKENENKVEFKKMNKNNCFNKDYYNEELNKINDSLFNMDNTLNKLKK